MADYIYTKVDDRALQLALDKMIALLSPPGAAAFLSQAVGPYLSRRAGERFASEGDDVTGPWAALKPATVAIRTEQGFGGEHPINVRTGELEDWVVDGGWDSYPTGAGASMRYPKNAPAGELRDKVQTAQIGKTDSPTVPRPVLGVNEADLAFVVAAYAGAFEAVFR